MKPLPLIKLSFCQVCLASYWLKAATMLSQLLGIAQYQWMPSTRRDPVPGQAKIHAKPRSR